MTLRAHGVRHRVGDVLLGQRVERRPDRRADLVRLQAGRRRVDRDRPLGLLERDRLVDLVPEDRVRGVGQLQPPVEHVDLPGEQPQRSRHQPLDVEVRRAAVRHEDHQVERAGAVGDLRLDARLARPLRQLDLGAAHLGDERDVAPHRQARDVGDLARVGVPPRVVGQQVPDRLDAERRELLQLGGLARCARSSSGSTCVRTLSW